MSSLVTEFAAVLGTVRRPGDFFAAGSADLLVPMMEVEGVGPIALPLLPIQAEQLIAVAERAPYGRGEATLLDTSVRRTWQIDAGRVHIGGKRGPMCGLASPNRWRCRRTGGGPAGFPVRVRTVRTLPVSSTIPNGKHGP